MVELFTNSRYPDQTPYSVASDLSLHCLPVTQLRVSSLQWVIISPFPLSAPQEDCGSQFQSFPGNFINYICLIHFQKRLVFRRIVLGFKDYLKFG